MEIIRSMIHARADVSAASMSTPRPQPSVSVGNEGEWSARRKCRLRKQLGEGLAEAAGHPLARQSVCRFNEILPAPLSSPD